jgi:hypothetical protein
MSDPLYPNIEALAAGMIAGEFRDWPRLRPEAKALLEAFAETSRRLGQECTRALAAVAVRHTAEALLLEEAHEHALAEQELRAPRQRAAEHAERMHLDLCKSRQETLTAEARVTEHAAEKERHALQLAAAVRLKERAEAACATAEKDRDEYRREFEMYARAWLRELGGKLIPKSHRIDALVLTTQAIVLEVNKARVAIRSLLERNGGPLSEDDDREYVMVRREDFDALAAACPAEMVPPPASFQERVDPWLKKCFGLPVARDRVERNHRFLEEALELVQANGCTLSEAEQLVEYVFARPLGQPHQETGGVMVTLAALCLASGLDMHRAGEDELARVWTKIDVIRQKQATKPKHSPLPSVAGPQPSAGETWDPCPTCKGSGVKQQPPHPYTPLCATCLRRTHGGCTLPETSSCADYLPTGGTTR